MQRHHVAIGREALIEVRGLRREYTVGSTTVEALRGVDLTIHRGEFVAIIGPSGAGKSTLLNLLGLLDEPSGGIYRLAGVEVSALAPAQVAAERGTELGFVFQHFHLLPHKTVAENVALAFQYASSVPEHDQPARVAAALDRVGISRLSGATPDQLSGGERQRVAIARAIVHEPSILLCDEPTGNLDSATSASILDLLGTLAGEGHTVVVVTHDHAVSARAHRVVEVNDGQIASDQRAPRLRPVDDTWIPATRTTPATTPERRGRMRRCVVEASMSLASRPGRFVSLAAGVAVGCASLVATAGIAGGSSMKVYEQFDRLAGTHAEATVALGDDDALGAATEATRSVAGLNGVAGVAALVQLDDVEVSITMPSGRDLGIAGPVVGATERIGELTNSTVGGDPAAIAATLSSRSDGIVIGSYLAERLGIPATLPRPVRLLVDGRPLMVVGVLAAPSFHGELESAVIVPIATLPSFGTPTSLTVLTETAVGAVRAVGDELPLAVDPASPDRVDVTRTGDPEELRDDIGSTLAFLMVAVGGLSMLLGAFGIMNALAASVSQRLGEIGLRRALGGTARQVSAMVLAEAAMVGVFGGTVGASLGAVVVWIASTVGDFPTAVNPLYVVAAPIAGTVIGMVAGIVPARRAAAVQPADALRTGV